MLYTGIFILVIGFIVGFIWGVLIFYLRFKVGDLVVVDDGEEPYTYAEFEDPKYNSIDKIVNKKVIILDVKKVNFIDHTQ